MLKSLVERWADEYPRVQGPTRVALVHVLVPVALVTHGVQTARHVVDVHVREGRGVALAPLEDRDLPEDTLDELRDGHPGWDGVGVDDDVGHDALAREGHVLLPVRHPDGTLLSVAGGELVPDLGNADVADAHLREAVALLRSAYQDVVDDAALGGLHGRAAVPLGVPRRRVSQRLRRRRLADEDIVAAHPRAWRDKAVLVELVVVAVFHAPGVVHRGLLERLRVEGADGPDRRGLLLVVVAPVVRRAEESAVDGALVHD
mmetsp:Transcript_21892/g.51641  ORF Transcript_21892/g.51641 Transcript_21892/m.51641 type:complete len:260 (-) Transcript_21892:256-1035(-)